MTATAELATSPDDRPERPRRPGLARSVRRAWRQLVSMRTALLLLFLLALAAVPGSLLPQRGLNPAGVERYYVQHPSLAPVLDRLYAFDVYGAPWFAAIYLALMISLVGCLLPRMRLHLRAMRAAPPAPPRHFTRLPLAESWTTIAPVADVEAAARKALRGWRVKAYGGGVSAERGYLRETGNLVFHVALLALLVGIGMGAAFGYKGAVLVVEGDTFVNTPAAYDELHPGRLNTAGHLPPFEVSLDDFRATYLPNGQPRSFAAAVRWRAAEGSAERAKTVKVNEPLTVRGARVYLLDHGYALHFTVRLPDGRVVYDQWTPFLPERGDPNLASTGAVKIGDLGGGLPDIGIRGLFVPTLGVRDGFAYSTYPAPKLPAFAYEAFAGDLGLGSGVPQNVYDLDTSKMVRTGQGLLLTGESAGHLPGGATLTFDGVKDFAVFQVTADPGKRVVLVASVLALLGLVLSLRVRRRRLWVRGLPTEAGTLVEVGGLARQDPEGFAPELAEVAARVRAAAPPAVPEEPS
ncbi:MAG TPA: cytochrome c biogenesis protein ResB [Mycobacteriales bacterium]|jgi:cytochrome c biogenesis protein|nr:cytochrome c biogenesis protein ResB [Mycobacteriales bacterium]